MRSLILATIAALTTLGTQTPEIRSTPPAVRASQYSGPTTPRAAREFIRAAGAGPAPTSCSARVDMRTTDLDEVRTVNPYTDPAPLQTIAVDFCVALDEMYRFENWGTFQPASVEVEERRVHFDVSFSPTFAPGFEIVTVDCVLTPEGFVLAPFDGAVDFAGSSGTSIHALDQQLGVAHLAVAPGGDAFFRSTFAVYFRTRSEGGDVHVAGTGAYLDQTETNAGGGIVFRWNQ